jgi:hypothetical protein
MMFREITGLLQEPHKHINTLCRKNAELLYIKACGAPTYSNHSVL